MHKILNQFINSLKVTFEPEKIKSVILYGSCAVEDCAQKFPNINLIVVMENLAAQDLKLAGKFAKKFEKHGRMLPLFMDYEEWKHSADVYAIEYTDIKDRYKVLYGQNIVDDLRVDNSDLRFQCEQETKNLLIMLRQTYLVKYDNKRVLKNLILASVKKFLVIFRSILRLYNVPVPKTHSEVVKLFAEKIRNCGFDFDADMFLKILEFKENKKVIKDCELEDYIQKLINTTNYVLKYVDKFNTCK